MGISNTIPPSRLIQPGVCTSSTRPTSPFEGQAIFETDTDRMYIWNGTAWVIPNSPAQNPTGLELITTHTVAGTGVTVSSSGLVTFSAATSISAINCFTSVYSNYRIVVDIDSANSATARTIKMRWRTTSGDDATANYDYASQMSSLGVSTFDVANAGNSVTEMIATQFYGYASQSAGFVIDVVTPQVATKKTKHIGTVYGGSAAQNLTGTFQSAISGAASSHTGFSIYPSTGNITGTLAIYGYRN